MDADTAAMPPGETGPAEPALPRISDYWPDARPALRRPPPLPLPEKAPRLWVKPVIGVVVALLLLTGATITGRRLLTRPTAAAPTTAAAPPPPIAGTDPAVGPATVLPEPSPSSADSPTAESPSAVSPSASKAPPLAPPPTSTAAKTPAAGASFVLATDVTTLSIGTARLDSGIARAEATDGSNAVPRLNLDGATAKLIVTAKEGQTKKVAVTLDDRITWTLRIDGGTRTTRVDLSGAAVARIDFTGGAHEIDLTLPRLRDPLPITMTGGVHDWQITTAKKAPVKLIARDGAGSVKLYGDDRGGLGKGVRVSTTDGSQGRLDLDAVGGIGSLIVGN